MKNKLFLSTSLLIYVLFLFTSCEKEYYLPEVPADIKKQNHESLGVINDIRLGDSSINFGGDPFSIDVEYTTSKNGEIVIIDAANRKTDKSDIEINNPINVDENYTDVSTTFASIDVTVTNALSSDAQLYEPVFHTTPRNTSTGQFPCDLLLLQAFAYYQQLADDTCQSVQGCIFCQETGRPIFYCITTTPGVVCNQSDDF